MSSLWFIGSTVWIVQVMIFCMMIGNGRTARQNYLASWRTIGTAVKGFFALFLPERSTSELPPVRGIGNLPPAGSANDTPVILTPTRFSSSAARERFCAALLEATRRVPDGKS